MALQASGTITMNQIRTELGVPNQSPFALDAAAKGTYNPINYCSPSFPSYDSPSSMSEWYNYCHTCTCGYYFCMGFSADTCTIACNNYNANACTCVNC
jgi:hypothetical protein